MTPPVFVRYVKNVVQVSTFEAGYAIMTMSGTQAAKHQGTMILDRAWPAAHDLRNLKTKKVNPPPSARSEVDIAEQNREGRGRLHNVKGVLTLWLSSLILTCSMIISS